MIGQTAQTQVRLLLQKQSDLGLPCLLLFKEFVQFQPWLPTYYLKTDRENCSKFWIIFHTYTWEHSGSVVECLTRDWEVAGSTSPASLPYGPWARYIYPSLVLVQPRKTCPCLIERLLMGRKESNHTYHTYTVKPVLGDHPKRMPKLVSNIDYPLMQVKSIAECSKWSILQYFWPSLSYHFSLRPLLSPDKVGGI